ncbi:hypothetical protein [Rhodopseudomonas sp. P2A-2r]|uniref:hypothetical protein n=1 Tax=unclassified Rhodopseudomonas TaxID=2638247 RepID=UPI0022343E84|nr:hypothetical protein [Rhodopseudomonas sp. P2A-2r]UZE47635.1 hypothetical protein ONR75_22415 [Rhodopseudomonas sp. P2A-2r]
MKRSIRSELSLSSIAAAVLGLVSAISPQIGSAAEPRLGFDAVLQIGSQGTSAIEIAPDRTWFLTGTQREVTVRDVNTGIIFRSLVASGGTRFTRMAISRDGSVVFARVARDTGEVETAAWSPATGLRIENAGMLAPPLEAYNWTWIEHKWPSSWPRDPDGPRDPATEKQYLVDQKLASLIDLEKVESVESTDRQDFIQVTTAGERQDGFDPFDNNAEPGWSYHVYFIDVIRKEIVADVSGKTLRTFCGRPHGAFAFDEQHLLLAPTELDASSSNVNALLVDVSATPPALKWTWPCQDTQVSGITFSRGLIIVRATPDQATIWDPATARRIMHLEDIYDSDVLAWSTDLSTFAVGFHEQRTTKERQGYGVEVVRSAKKLFFRTDEEVLEIRLGEDGSKIFARTNAGWSAWNAASNTKLSSFVLPSAPDEAIRGYQSNESPRAKLEVVQPAYGVDPCADLRSTSNMSIKLCDIASGRSLWLATASDGTAGREFLIVQFADGRVLVSEGAEDLVKFVKAFDVRPFTDQRGR